MPDSIIVYRNPLEAAFWEGGYAFPLIVFMVVTVIVAAILMKSAEHLFRPRRHVAEKLNYVLLAVSCGVGFGALWWLL